MAREIIFKAKRKKCNGTTGKWVEGSLLKVGDRYYICSEPYQCAKYHSSLNGEEIGFGGFVLVDEATICKYTGLTDKNGNKIWENDVIQYKDIKALGKVEYIEDSFCLNDVDDGKQYIEGMWNKFEVIGNIFDNPELLEGRVV